MYKVDDGTRTLKNLFWKMFAYLHLMSFIMLTVLLAIALIAEKDNVDNFLEAAHFLVMICSLTVGNIDFLYYRKDLDTLLR